MSGRDSPQSVRQAGTDRAVLHSADHQFEHSPIVEVARVRSAWIGEKRRDGELAVRHVHVGEEHLVPRQVSILFLDEPRKNVVRVAERNDLPVVLIVERWILARLRNRRFFSAADLNVAIGELVGDINARVMKGYDASRVELFAAIDKPVEAAAWRALRIRGLEALPGRPRLPHRDRRPLVFGALPPHQGIG
jgi:hypothetical protein